MNLGYIRYGFSIAFRSLILLQWLNVAPYRCLKSRPTRLANNKDKIRLRKPDNGMQCRPHLINCCPVILKIHKGDSLNISQEYKRTKKRGTIFCLHGVFFFKTEHHTSNKWNIQQTSMQTKHTTKTCNKLNLKQWQVTTCIYMYEVMTSSFRKPEWLGFQNFFYPVP